MADTVGFVAEIETGGEIQFCPIRQLPISRSQRVRTLPGFHLLSLSAGREALARGHYEAFGERFTCTGLEYLHADDKVFTCAEDHKAFKNHMSMQYHRYIRHELEERKALRKRLLERAAERQERSLRLEAAKQRQPLPLPTAPSPVKAAGGREAATDPRDATAPSSMGVVGMQAASLLLAGGTTAAAAANDAVVDDPYTVPEEEKDLDESEIGSAAPAASAAPRPAAAAAATTAAEKPAAVKRPMVAAAEDDEEDLYGDVGGPEVKKQKSASTYASAIGAMMTDDFDDDE